MTARILIADDNDFARGGMSKLLRFHDGWEVCAEVENGQQAVSKAIELKPEIVVLDLAMPVLNGLQAAREISRELPSVPVVLYTLYNLPPLDVEAKKVGIRQVVSKSDTGGLVRAVQNILTEQQKTPVTSAAASDF